MANEKREFIDPKVLMNYINETHSYARLPMAAHICTMELLTYAPRVDAVEVVRCKDCKHWRSYQYNGRNDGWCAMLLEHYDAAVPYTSFDHFCAHGERRC